MPDRGACGDLLADGQLLRVLPQPYIPLRRVEAAQFRLQIAGPQAPVLGDVQDGDGECPVQVADIRQHAGTVPGPGRLGDRRDAFRTSAMVGPRSITAASRDTGAFRYTNQRTGRPSRNRRRNSWVFCPRQISS